MRRAQLALGIALCAVLLAPTLAHAQNPSMKSVMRNKMDNAQVLLRAVVNGDFATVDRAAVRLSRISEMEIASWQTPGQPEYTDQAMRFLTSVQDLRSAARRRDQRAAGTAYASLVSSCATCHAVAKRSRVVRWTP